MSKALSLDLRAVSCCRCGRIVLKGPASRGNSTVSARAGHFSPAAAPEGHGILVTRTQLPVRVRSSRSFALRVALRMPTAALGIMCKAPRAGAAKTRLAPMLGAEDAAVLSACFLRDVAAAVEATPPRLGRKGFGVYSPAGCETDLRAILPKSFELVLQENADFGVVLWSAARLFLEAGHDCAVLINSDSPTLPSELLSEAIEALRMRGERVVLGPATDGGYYLIGLKAPYRQLFSNMPWSTPNLLRLTVERAREIGLSVTTLPTWYDVDDAATFAILERELAGHRPPFAAPGLVGGPAVRTRAFVEALRTRTMPTMATATSS
jgi:uncharacterized protein